MCLTRKEVGRHLLKPHFTGDHIASATLKIYLAIGCFIIVCRDGHQIGLFIIERAPVFKFTFHIAPPAEFDCFNLAGSTLNSKHLNISLGSKDLLTEHGKA